MLINAENNIKREQTVVQFVVLAQIKLSSATERRESTQQF